MFQRILFILLFFKLVTVYPANLYAQINIANIPGKVDQEILFKDPLFDNDDILRIKLTGKLTELFNDRNDNAVYHPMLLQYKDKNNGPISIQLKIQTRGNFRRKKENCDMPPLMLNFAGSNKKNNSIFQDENKLKLVVPCKGDEYVIKEWLVYKLYNLITEKSFKARLVQVEFEDSLKKKKTETHYCILLEDEKKVAARNKSFVWNKIKVPMKNTDKEQFLKMAVFEFMIGNTDWSVPYLQNVKLITNDSSKAPYTVPYDFDHAGMVSAPYALPAEELEMSSVVERRYRGYCETDKGKLAHVFSLFNQLKNKFYTLYASCQLINYRYKKFAANYLDDFFKIINNNKVMENAFGDPCTRSTRVEIQGLKIRK